MHSSMPSFCKPFNQVTVHVFQCSTDNCLCIHCSFVFFLVVARSRQDEITLKAPGTHLVEKKSSEFLIYTGCGIYKHPAIFSFMVKQLAKGIY